MHFHFKQMPMNVGTYNVQRENQTATQVTMVIQNTGFLPYFISYLNYAYKMKRKRVAQCISHKLFTMSITIAHNILFIVIFYGYVRIID